MLNLLNNVVKRSCFGVSLPYWGYRSLAGFAYVSEKKAKGKSVEESKQIVPVKLQNVQEVKIENAKAGAAPTDQQAKPKREHWKVKTGAHLYITKLINEHGPLSHHDIWTIYKRDQALQNLDYFRSKTYLKTVIMKTMERMEKLKRGKYNKKARKFEGFKLNVERAFKNVDPEVLESLKPKPNIKYFREKAQKEKAEQQPQESGEKAGPLPEIRIS